MASVVVTISIMPTEPSINLDALLIQSTKAVSDFGGEVGKHRIEPVAFGLKALKVLFVMPESIGSTEPLEQTISAFEGVASVTTEDVRRSIG